MRWTKKKRKIRKNWNNKVEQNKECQVNGSEMKTRSTPDHEVIELFLASSDHLINGLVIGYFIFLLRNERKQMRA